MTSDDGYKQFAIVRNVEDCSIVLHVFGDVDLSTVDELKEAIDDIARRGDRVLINLSKCRYFDSSGLAALNQARKVFGSRLRILVDPKSQVSRVMSIVGFDKLFNVVTEFGTARWNDYVVAGEYVRDLTRNLHTTQDSARLELMIRTVETQTPRS